MKDMALEMVGGAFLSSFLDVLFDRIASREFIDLFKSRKMNKGLLQKLKILPNTVNGVLNDAEDKQITAPAVKIWLDDLREAAYEADDLLDVIAYEATRLKVEAEQQTTADQVRDWLSFHNPFKKARSEEVLSFGEVPKRMEDIVERLEVLVQQIGALGLREGAGCKNALSVRKTESTSVVNESGVVGRDGNKEAIFKLLQTNGADENIGVIPIVGMGGIGKTTLAQLVYNDSRAHDLFKSRAWVCVSENYDGFRIKREILKQLNTFEKYDNLTPEQIDVKLKESLMSKRYLVVLDDMWNDSYGDWVQLLTPLESGALGSKIIVTTRNENVASIMGTIPSSYQLHELSDHNCWLLFIKHAFHGESVNDQRLEAIGKKIVRKCRGLPLAAKMLGGLLRRKQDIAEWDDILNSNIWDLPNDSILPALRLSYQHLPSYLKQCFAYFAIFPKDYEVNKEEVVLLWLAEGFLGQFEGGRKMKELGEKYFHELVSRSFLRQTKWGGQPRFLMHDLIHDLAQVISGEFLSRIEGGSSCKISKRNRYLSYVESETDTSKTLEGINESQSLRTFLHLPLLFHWPNEEEIVDEMVYNLVPCFRCLRVVSLCGFRTMVRLPDSISNLKHLRYLNLARTHVKKLPESLCTLYNLQSLILHWCSELVELPKNTGNLINLQYLDIEETIRLRDMPPRMGNLNNLQTLPKYIVGKQNGCDINELGKLQHVRGALSITKLENAMDPSSDILKNKKHLNVLKLSWSSDTEDSLHERNLLERLQPCTSIRELSICGYGGTRFADWVGNSSYTNVVSLILEKCRHCTSLPPLGQLPFLEELYISEFSEVVKVGAEFCGSCSISTETPFRSLKTLDFIYMSRWQDWIICEENDSVKCESFAKLERLTIWHCPKVKSISLCDGNHKIFKSLYKLEVKMCPSFKISNLLSISNFRYLNIYYDYITVNLKQLDSAMYLLNIDGRPARGDLGDLPILFTALSVEDIKITDNWLVFIPLEMIPKLRSLYVKECHKLRSLSASEEPLNQPLTSLASLEIIDCPRLTSFPGGIAAPNLTHLELSYCSGLKSLPQHMHVLFPSLVHLKVRGSSRLESFPDGGLPTKLQSLEIEFCDKLIAGRLQWGLQGLDALSQLSLVGYEGDDLESFPEQTLLPSTLKSFKIDNFRSLKFLNYKGLQHVTSLTELVIEDCNVLRCLPEEGLPSSISVVKIWYCRFLGERCEREKGEDWPKISHISTIVINGERM